ncbi:MAG: CDP-alcohol phosphatidyltransferase family protein [Thiobacillus sp.]|jgi:cardiolipin synthase|uniref:CDP-alcohol phosphatidyltransferase family protein n=1 Tax=Thiobacillus sp. TaxID=924 RepID=UPI0028962938|nr:CDP-alcohol phosphatidyltransferase family protein [Thiobacillus sp.]MDT3707845.1 CDP-alcohol phosphatidyltransferase family protein [Thiobacillus sp.]
MNGRVLNLPNAITLLRLAAVPVVGWLILHERWEAACWLFLAAAVSDGIDGLLARWLNQMTQLGAALDSIADKALGLVTLVMLTIEEAIPMWVTLAILLRDTIIVLGALSYRGMAGHLEIHPTWLGKTHMFAEFAMLALVLGGLAELLVLEDWRLPLFAIVFGIAVASGVQYVWIWSAKARRERAAAHLKHQ